MYAQSTPSPVAAVYNEVKVMSRYTRVDTPIPASQISLPTRVIHTYVLVDMEIVILKQYLYITD